MNASAPLPEGIEVRLKRIPPHKSTAYSGKNTSRPTEATCIVAKTYPAPHWWLSNAKALKLSQRATATQTSFLFTLCSREISEHVFEVFECSSVFELCLCSKSAFGCVRVNSIAKSVCVRGVREHSVREHVFGCVRGPGCSRATNIYIYIHIYKLPIYRLKRPLCYRPRGRIWGSMRWYLTDCVLAQAFDSLCALIICLNSVTGWTQPSSVVPTIAEIYTKNAHKYMHYFFVEIYIKNA